MREPMVPKSIDSHKISPFPVIGMSSTQYLSSPFLSVLTSWSTDEVQLSVVGSLVCVRARHIVLVKW